MMRKLPYPPFGLGSSRFSEVFDSVQLAETSTLAPSKPVPRVRIHFPPPHSLKCQRNPPGLLLKLREMGAIPHLLLSKWTGESVLLIAAGKLCSLFLRRAYEQSGFNNSVRRMQCDHKPIMRRKQLDFVSTGGTAMKPAS